MLAARFRLSRADVLRIKNNSQRVSAFSFSAQVSPNALNYSRFGVVVSRKLDTRAVVRNQLRRRIYSALDKNSLAGRDILFFPKSGMLKLGYAEICSQLHSFLSEVSGLS